MLDGVVGHSENGQAMRLYLHGRSGGVWEARWLSVASLDEAREHVEVWARRWGAFSAVLWEDDHRVWSRSA